MLETLLASRAAGERRTIGTLASIVLHSGAIALAIVSTGRAATHPEPEPAPPTLIYTAPPAPVSPSHSRAAPGGAPAGPTSHIDRVRPVFPPPVIPPSLPLPDLSRSITDQGLFDGRTNPLAREVGQGSDAMTGPADGIWTAPQVEKAVMARADNPQPRYPEALRAAHVQGSVIARFVVDSTGRVEPGSIILADATQALFADAVREALLRSRYFPAEVGGRRVRQLVEQRFVFDLQR